MATESKRQRQLAENEATWLANDPVLLAGEIAFVTDKADFKLGPGQFSALPYYLQSGFLKLTGGTITGPVTVQSSITRIGVVGQAQLRGEATAAPLQIRTMQADTAASAQITYIDSGGATIAAVSPRSTVAPFVYTLLSRQMGDARYIEQTGGTVNGDLNVIGNFTAKWNAGEPSFIYMEGPEGTQVGSLFHSAGDDAITLSSAQNDGSGRRFFQFTPSTLPLQGGSVLRKADADGLYLQLTGGTMSGDLRVDAELQVHSATDGANAIQRFRNFAGADVGLFYHSVGGDDIRLLSRDAAGENSLGFEFRNAAQSLGTNTVLRKADADSLYVSKDDGSSITAGNTFPTGVDDNALHYLTVEPVGLYVYLMDQGGEAQWVQTNGGGGGVVEQITRQWADVRSQRSANVIYQNTTGVELGVVGQMSGVGNFEVSPDQATWTNVGNTINNGQDIRQAFFEVPPNYYYRYDGSGSPQIWSELSGGRTYTSVPGAMQTFHDPTGRASWSVLGDMLECWGSATAIATGPTTVPFPKTFANPPNVLLTPIYDSGPSPVLISRSLKTTQFQMNASNNTNDQGRATDFSWYAKGKWDGVS